MENSPSQKRVPNRRQSANSTMNTKAMHICLCSCSRDTHPNIYHRRRLSNCRVRCYRQRPNRGGCLAPLLGVGCGSVLCGSSMCNRHQPRRSSCRCIRSSLPPRRFVRSFHPEQQKRCDGCKHPRRCCLRCCLQWWALRSC